MTIAAPLRQSLRTAEVTDRPRVVIVGAGFGGLTTTRSLASVPVKITLIDRRNHHLFQPLLYQVATAGLSPAQIATPIRHVVRNQKNTTVLLGEVVGVNVAAQEVELGEERVGYDYLVIATGARHSYFGHDDWAPFAPGLKSLEDATEIRRRILLAFELAELRSSEPERKRLLTFVVIGGGPTGVELAGKIIEIARHALAAEYRNFDPTSARVLLVEAGGRILPSFPEALSRNALQKLEQLGVEILLGKPVTLCSAEGVEIAGEKIPSSTIIWAAGVAASPAARWINAPSDRAGRVIVDGFLHPPGHENIFVIGDTASITNTDGKLVPGLAAAAKQQGLNVARAITALVAGQAQMKPFKYTDLGSLATVGRNAAVIDFGRLRLTGFAAWLAWSTVHIYFLIGFRNRFSAVVDWIWTYLTFNRSARLITSAPAHDGTFKDGTSST